MPQKMIFATVVPTLKTLFTTITNFQKNLNLKYVLYISIIYTSVNWAQLERWKDSRHCWVCPMFESRNENHSIFFPRKYSTIATLTFHQIKLFLTFTLCHNKLFGHFHSAGIYIPTLTFRQNILFPTLFLSKHVIPDKYFLPKYVILAPIFRWE